MNPAFLILVLLIAVALWFLLSFVFIQLGNFVHSIYKDAVDQIEQDDNNTRKEHKNDKR